MSGRQASTPYLLFAMMILLFSSGCAQQKSKKHNNVEVQFTTHIDTEDNKQFNYQLTQTKHSRRERSEGRAGAKPKRDGREHRGDHQHGDHEKLDRFRQKAEENLNTLLQGNGFCEAGYTVIDEKVSKRMAVVKGQCIEKATPKDRKRFPNIQQYSEVIEEDLGNL